jgi:hypothetical protein
MHSTLAQLLKYCLRFNLTRPLTVAEIEAAVGTIGENIPTAIGASSFIGR